MKYLLLWCGEVVVKLWCDGRSDAHAPPILLSHQLTSPLFHFDPVVSQQDDVDLLPPPRKRGISDDYFIQDLTPSSSHGSDEKKLVFDSVLLSIWGSQGGYRAERIKASCNSIKSAGSSSNLQLHIDEYDQSSPKYDKNSSSKGCEEATHDVVPAVPTEFMVSALILTLKVLFYPRKSSYLCIHMSDRLKHISVSIFIHLTFWSSSIFYDRF